MWHLGMWFNSRLGSVRPWLDLVILRIFSELNDSVILFHDSTFFIV